MIIVRINNNPDLDRMFTNKNEAQSYIDNLAKKGIKTKVL